MLRSIQRGINVGLFIGSAIATSVGVIQGIEWAWKEYIIGSNPVQ
jgi:hypothetical protein